MNNIKEDKTPRLYVCEGYEIVGKSSFIEKYLSHAIKYRPSYEDLNLKDYIPGNSRSLLGVTVLDFLSQNPMLVNQDIVFDRGILSGLIYARMYPQNGYDIKNDISKFTKLYSEMGAVLIYLHHEDKELARQMFESSQTRETNDSTFDPATFEEYWEKYQQMHEWSVELINHYFMPAGIKCIFFTPSDNEEYIKSKLSSI